jgi:hypothetical protein
VIEKKLNHDARLHEVCTSNPTNGLRTSKFQTSSRMMLTRDQINALIEVAIEITLISWIYLDCTGVKS